MTHFIRMVESEFGTVSVLTLSKDLVAHAHPEAQIVIGLSSNLSDVMIVNKKRVSLTFDRAVFVNPMEEHAHKVRSDDARFMVIYIRPTWLISNFPRSVNGCFSRTNQFQVSPSIRRLADDFLRLSPESVNTEATTDIVRNIVAEVENCMILESSKFERNLANEEMFDDRIPKAIAFMRENISSNKNMESVAREVGVSRNQLFKLFREYLNTTPNICWNALRMDYARTQLVTSNSSIDRLTSELGFSESSNFSRFFRNNTGVYPSQFRAAAHINGNQLGPTPTAVKLSS